MPSNCGAGENSWESNCKEINPVNPKKNQPRTFIGRTDGEAEALILWPPNVKSWLIGKDPDAGKDWRQEKKGMTEDEVVVWHHWLEGHELEKLRELVMDKEAWHSARGSMGSQRVRHNWVTEQNLNLLTEGLASWASVYSSIRWVW